MGFTDRINNMGLRNKLIFIYIVSVWIPFSIMGLLFAYYNQNVVKEQQLKTVQSRSLNYSQMLNSQFTIYESLANLWANNNDLRTGLEAPYQSVMDALDVYQDIWDQYRMGRSSWPYLRNITIYPSNTSLHNSYPYLVRLDTYMESQPEYPLIMSSGTTGYWSAFRNVDKREYWEPGNLIPSKTPYRTFTFNRVLYSPKHLGIPIGILTVEVDSRAITDIINAADDLHIVLLDNTGTPLISSETDKEIDYEEIYGNQQEGKVQVEKEWYYLESFLLNNGWKMISITPLSQTNAAPTWLFGGMLFLLVSLIIIPLILLFSRQLSRRFDAVIKKMEKFMSGNLELGEPIPGKDEAGVLDTHFTQLAGKLKKQIHETYIMQIQKEKLRLEVLQTQINPHFLYNTLSTIAWLADEHPREEIREAVEDLEAFYRQTLSSGKDLVSLESELQAVKAYLNLQKKRYVNRVSAYYHIDPLTLEIQIPKVTLQPLVENCIRHGLTGDRNNVSIVIDSRIQGEQAVIEVRDNGAGMSAEKLGQLADGTSTSGDRDSVGFRNVNDRIKLYYGEPYGLTVSSQLGVGTSVTILLPCKTAEPSPSEAALLEINTKEDSNEPS